MAGASVSHMVIFIASMGIAVGVAGALVATVDNVSDSVTDRGEGLSETVETSIAVISDPGSGAVYDDTEDEVTLLVKNTGSTTLEASEGQVDLLVNGEFVGEISVEVVSNGIDDWSSGEVAEVVGEDVELDQGDHRAVVVVNENREVFEFRT